MSTAEETIAQLAQSVQMLQRELEEVRQARQQVQAPVTNTVTPRAPKPDAFSGRANVHAWL